MLILATTQILLPDHHLLQPNALLNLREMGLTYKINKASDNLNGNLLCYRPSTQNCQP